MIQLKKDNSFLMWALIFIAIIVILSAVYYAAVYFGEDTNKEDEEPIEEVTVDERVSPLVNQGLTVEINRIRHRGLLDKILRNGRSWRDTPTYYYIATLDGLEYISKDISAAGGASAELMFTEWDSIFNDNRVQKDIDEEQKTATVSIAIMERESTGLIGLGSKDTEKEKIEVTYDFRTGHWTGDDYLMDDDGYGHYVGDDFEFWFHIYQPDFDADQIPYWAEVNVLGSDPRLDDRVRDPDGDGVPTAWEWHWGYDPYTWEDHEHLDPDVDGIQNIEEYQMEKYFADPYSQDIYIEVDGMVKGGLFDIVHEFYDESGQIMIERFTQHGINLYIDNGWPDGPINGGGELLPHYETIDQDSGVMLQFYKHNFADDRKGIFRYMIVGHNAGFCIPSTFNRYDTIVIDSSPYRLIKRTAFTPRTQRIVLASAALHELGHSLGVAPWTFQGCDNLTFAQGQRQEFASTWGDYYSVMNYYHIWDKKLADYSLGTNGGPYDQNDYENFYLPTFYIDVNAIEDTELELPGTNRLVYDVPEPVGKGWRYDENLTMNHSAMLQSLSYVENMDCDYRVYVKNETINESSSDSVVRIYAKPDSGTSYSEWSLISIGMVDEDQDISLYYQQERIDTMMMS